MAGRVCQGCEGGAGQAGRGQKGQAEKMYGLSVAEQLPLDATWFYLMFVSRRTQITKSSQKKVKHYGTPQLRRWKGLLQITSSAAPRMPQCGWRCCLFGHRVLAMQHAIAMLSEAGMAPRATSGGRKWSLQVSDCRARWSQKTSDGCGIVFSFRVFEQHVQTLLYGFLGDKHTRNSVWTITGLVRCFSSNPKTKTEPEPWNPGTLEPWNLAAEAGLMSSCNFSIDRGSVSEWWTAGRNLSNVKPLSCCSSSCMGIR